MTLFEFSPLSILNLTQKLYLKNLSEVLNEPLKGRKERGGRCKSCTATSITLQEHLRPYLNKKPK